MEKAYTGKISNYGSQIVKAPTKPTGSANAPVKKTGGDLRSK
jgi:hypothetical protein